MAVINIIIIKVIIIKIIVTKVTIISVAFTAFYFTSYTFFKSEATIPQGSFQMLNSCAPKSNNHEKITLFFTLFCSGFHESCSALSAQS